MKKAKNLNNAQTQALNIPVVRHCNRPLVKHLVRIDDKHGDKGACWYYAVKARCEHEAIELTKEQHPELKDNWMSAFEPKYKAKEKVGELIYYDGDPRL